MLLGAKGMAWDVSEDCYVFCRNDASDAIDGFGLYTVEAGRCQIIILIGHGSTSAPHQFVFKHKCSAGHFVGCYSKATNERIPEQHRIPGAPSAESELWLTPGDNMDKEEDWHSHYEETWQAARQLARSMCGRSECCCQYVDVRDKLAGSRLNPGNWSFPSLRREKVFCN